MKTGIHPTQHQTQVTCSCGAKYTINGTLKKLHTEICMKCHPHYTGKKKLVDTEGRVEKFMAKFKDQDGSESTPSTTPKSATKKEKDQKDEESKQEKINDEQKEEENSDDGSEISEEDSSEKNEEGQKEKKGRKK